VFLAILVFSGILPLPKPSLVFLLRDHQNFGESVAVKGSSIAKRPAAFVGFFISGLQSKNNCHRWIDL
jgi:hypothetical protein